MNRSKRKAFRTYMTQQSGLNSANPLKSVQRSVNEPEVPFTLDNAQISILKIIQYANLMNLFKQSIYRFKGTNQAVDYRNEYDFSQKWEQTNKIKHQRNHNLLLSANGLCLFIAFLIMLHKIPLIWHFSIYKIFAMDDSDIWFYTGVIFVSSDLFLKIYLLQTEIAKNMQKMEVKQQLIRLEIANLVVGDIFSLIVFVLEMSIPQSGNYELILDVLVIFFQFNRFLQIYNSLTILLITYKYKNYVNLFSFVSKLIVILHFFSILVYSVSLIDPSDNWLAAIGKQNKQPYTKYIISIYFTGTTMFTVGYGDILPVNNLEIIVITIIQMVGIVLIGYIVSEIGHTLSIMRQVRQDFEQDIQNTDTICQYYQLSQDLKHRVRNHIINHQLANEELNINEENHFLMKLNEELRNQVKHANQLKIIKTSLFFVCNWSKKMQSQLSKKLQKFIFSPNERIMNKDRLYIVTKGKVDVYTEKKLGSKVYCKKHLKTIQRDQTKEVFSNVYGCTSLFTGKSSKLTAVSKDFAICYALDFNDILDIVKDDQRDFQYFHQTRNRLQLQKFPQKYEIPDLINNRQHYSPTKWIVLRKYQRECQKNSARVYMIRHARKKKLLITHEKDQDLVDQSDSEVIQSQDQLDKLLQASKKIPKKRAHIPKEETNLATDNHPSLVTFRSYRRKNYHKTEQKLKEVEVKDLMANNIIITSLFEIGKDFIRYFKRGNKKQVLMRLNKNSIKDFTPINSKNMSLSWLDIIIFGNKIGAKQLLQKNSIHL